MHGIEIGRQVVARAGGNPFFILEIIDALVERSILRPDRSADDRLRWVDARRQSRYRPRWKR